MPRLQHERTKNIVDSGYFLVTGYAPSSLSSDVLRINVKWCIKEIIIPCYHTCHRSCMSSQIQCDNGLVFGSIFYLGEANSLLAKTHSEKSKSEHTDEEIQDDVPNELRRPKRVRRAPMMNPTSRPFLTCIGNFQEYLLSLKIQPSCWLISSAIKKQCQDSMETDMCRRAWAICRENLVSIVSRPVRCKIVGCKLVFRIKLGKDGQVEQYKARLIDQGFSQILRIDSDETLAPVTYHQTLQMLLALVNQHCWHGCSAFLNDDLKNEFACTQGVEAKEGEVRLLSWKCWSWGIH